MHFQHKLSARSGRIGESATLRVSRRAKELAAAGRDIVDLSAGEPDFPSPAVAVDAAVAALHAGFTRYTENTGIPDLRAALAARYRERYGAPWTVVETLITVGGKAALFEVALALFEHGHEVVIPSPCWVSLPEQVRFAGATPVFVETVGADSFRMHADAILAAFTEHTRGVILNSPCNPTGGIIALEDLRRVVEACAARGITLIFDETYERFFYDGGEHASAAAFAAQYPDTIVVVGSFSKTYAMTGWRIGYALGPRSVIAAAANIQSHATSNATSFAMSGALAALRGAEPEVQTMIAEYEARRNFLIPALNAIPGFSCRPPAGAFYAFVDVSACFRAGIEGSLPFCEHLLEQAGVAVVPGVAFGDDRYLRISFACSRDMLASGLERMSTVAAALAPT
ncbi:MAG: pyridoxal phosphate-dependent aminotransferase [Acidobacteriota bacterium]